MDKVYRIYTQDVHRTVVIALAAELFDNFTIHDTVGYYQGHEEKSIVVEIVGGEESNTQLLAQRIRGATGQESILMLALSGNAERI